MSASRPEDDTKDWTWVLERPCPECGYDAGALDPSTLPARLRDDARAWALALAGPDVGARSDPGRWSVLEYACHVRDVHRVFAERLRLMLAQEDPLFANWDQDETARAERYDLQDPAAVARELTAAADAVAALYAGVGETEWRRRGRRSNGSDFTVDSLGRYHLHDVVHHRHDVER